MVSTAPAFTPPLTKQIFLTSWPKIGQKSEKWQWRHNFPEWRHHNNFLSCFLSLAKFSYWSKFHVNIITGFGIITIFFYKGLNRNPEIGNTPVFCPISGDRGKLWIPNLARMSPIKYYWMLQNSRVTALTVFELLRENQLAGVKLPPSLSPPN